MSTPTDPDVAEADRRVDRAKDSLLSRVHELGRRFGTTKDKLDLKEQIAAHPLAAVGIAAALGALSALGQPRRARERNRHTRGNLIAASIGAIALRLVKGAAIRQAGAAAASWFDGLIDRDPQDAASHDASVEAFLEH